MITTENYAEWSKYIITFNCHNMNEVKLSSLSNSTTARRARSPITAVKLVLHTAIQIKRRQDQMVHIQFIKTAKPASVSPVWEVLLREIGTQVAEEPFDSYTPNRKGGGREAHKKQPCGSISQSYISTFVLGGLAGCPARCGSD